MKLLIPLLAIGIAAGSAVVLSGEKNDAPGWHRDWRTAQRIAMKADKPIFAVLACLH
jgi:hypothetical protein